MNTPTREATSGELRAWGWVRHLRVGGTTPWDRWTDQATEGSRGGRLLPGAQQLELLRRLNLAGRPDATLVGRVLSASAPGRGRPDLELRGAVDELDFGPKPVDPAELPDDELLRVATMLLAEDLVAAGPPAKAPRTPIPWAPAYRLSGDPWLVRASRPELVRRRRPPSAKPERILVLAADLATMLADVWTARCFADGAEAWPAWVGGLARQDRLPGRVDLPAVAAAAAARVGAENVHVVLDPTALAGLVGLRRSLSAVARPGTDAADLARLTVGPLGLLVTPGPRARLLRERLLPRLATAGGAPQVAERHHDWLHHRAEQIRDALAAGGYPVHGDLGMLLPVSAGPEHTAARRDRVLALALHQLLRRTG